MGHTWATSSAAASRASTAATTLASTSGPAGEIDPAPDGLIAICGPKSSPTMHQIIGTDPVFDYSPDEAGRWRIVDCTTGVNTPRPSTTTLAKTGTSPISPACSDPTAAPSW